MDYNRQAAVPRFEAILAKPAQADEALGQAYLALVSFKMGMDQMEEIPPHIQPLYDQVGRAISEVAEARKHTNQLREMTRRVVH